MGKKATISAACMLSPSVRSLALTPADGPLVFKAGQWVNLYVPSSAGLIKRAYSIASAPSAPSFELAVTLVQEGVASPLLHALRVGEELEFDGPHGFFTREEALQAAPALYVGTGTGLAPLRSMLLAATSEAQRVPATLLFGCRSEADILWREQLAALAAARPELSVVVTLSQPGPGWTGRVGYVQAHVAELAHALGAPHVFICGLQRMVSVVRAVCKEQLGYDRAHVHSERYD